MVGVGVFVVWLGYLVVYYGLDQIRGGNNGLLDLALPARSSKLDTGANDPDSGSQNPPPKAPGTQVIPPTPGGAGYHSKADSIPTKKIPTTPNPQYPNN